MTIAVSSVVGIGPKTTEFLHSKGVDTVEALIAAGPAVLAGAPGFSEGRARQVFANLEGVGGAPAPVSPQSPEKGSKPGKKGKSKAKKGKKEDKGKKDKKPENDKKKKKKEKKKGKKKKK